MKRLLFLVFLILSSYCGFSQSNSYQIKGDIKNFPAKQVYLRIVKLNPKTEKFYATVIDSAKVSNGAFLLHRDSSISEPCWESWISYIDTITKKSNRLIFQNNYTGKINKGFILENANFSIQGDNKDEKGLSIAGSKETDFLFKYGLILPPDTEKIDKKIDSLKKSKNTAALAAAQEERKQIIRLFKSDFKKMLVENSSTYMALFMLQLRSKSFTPADLEELFPVLAKDYLQTPAGIRLTDFMKHNKSLEIGQFLPDFTYVDQFQKKFSLNQVKGSRGTLVVFWASWCGPCRQEIPELKKLYAKYKNKGISIVSISTDHNITEWKKALLYEKMSWPNLSNLPGNSKEINQTYNLNAIPSMFLLDKDNKIIIADEFEMTKIEPQVAKLAK